jgi:hypothetical protein
MPRTRSLTDRVCPQAQHEKRPGLSGGGCYTRKRRRYSSSSRSWGAQSEQMSGWSPREAIAMEKRHILEGAKRVARQEALVRNLVEQGHNQLADAAKQMVELFRDSLELSRGRLGDLENRYGTAPGEK